MPRLVNSVPKYRRHRASNEGVVTLNGHAYYRGPYGTKASRLGYDRLIGEWLAIGRNPLHTAGNELTILELCSQYRNSALRYYRRNGRDTSDISGIKSALKYLRTLYGRTLAVEFGPLALKAVRQRMSDDDLSRFRQEDGFRDHKQRLGMKECRAWTKEPILRTFQVQMLALTLLRLVQFRLDAARGARWCPAPAWNPEKKHASILDLRRLFWKHRARFSQLLAALDGLQKPPQTKYDCGQQTARAA